MSAVVLLGIAALNAQHLIYPKLSAFSITRRTILQDYTDCAGDRVRLLISRMRLPLSVLEANQTFAFSFSSSEPQRCKTLGIDSQVRIFYQFR